MGLTVNTRSRLGVNENYLNFSIYQLASASFFYFLFFFGGGGTNVLL